MSYGLARARRGSGPAGAGFTLIEILIVISIIALLSSLILVAVNRARQGAAEATANVEISSLNQAVSQYVQDESEYPGMHEEGVDEETNQFPVLFNALCGRRKPKGPGGRNAPYLKVEESKLWVWESDIEEYRQATQEELRDEGTKKFMMDPWGKPYVYRCNKGREEKDYMHNPYEADIYSFGPNGNDDTVEGSAESDDIGNW